jgi:signal transduction histidine kinase
MLSLPSLILVASALLTGVLAAYTWRYRSFGSPTRYAALLLAAMTLHAGGYGLELAAPDLATALVWVRIQYLGIAVIPPLVLGMIVTFAGYGRVFTRPVLGALFVVPTVTLVLVMAMHSLYFEQVGFDPGAAVRHVTFEAGPWYLVHALYLLLAVAGAFALLGITHMRSTDRLFRRQCRVTMVGTALPLLAYIVFLAAPGMIGQVDVIPFTYAMTALAFTIGILRFRLFGLGPVGHSTVVERIPIGVLVIDPSRRVIEANPAATALFGTGHPPIGRTLDEISAALPGLPEVVDAARGIETALSVAERRYLVSVSRLTPGPDEVGGMVVLIRDITSYRRAEEALAKRTADLEGANERLTLLSAITRHDIANQLVAIDGYLSLLRDESRECAATGPIEGLARAVDRVRAMVEFMRDYPSIGVEAPAWLDLHETVERAIRSVTPGGITIDNRLRRIDVFADPLLERVFSTLIENAVRHGGSVTRIRIEAVSRANGLLVTVEDDGIGVRDSDKSRIFEEGIGRNTGLGLFLASEILKSMEMSIVESGVPGKGARFEIQIPRERLRME